MQVRKIQYIVQKSCKFLFVQRAPPREQLPPKTKALLKSLSGFGKHPIFSSYVEGCVIIKCKIFRDSSDWILKLVWFSQKFQEWQIYHLKILGNILQALLIMWKLMKRELTSVLRKYWQELRQGVYRCKILGFGFIALSNCKSLTVNSLFEMKADESYLRTSYVRGRTKLYSSKP